MPSSTLRATRALCLAAVLAGALACAPPREEAEIAVPAATVTDRARVFLIELEDGGSAAPRAGCSGSAVPVEVPLPVPRPALEGALAALVALRAPIHPATGFYNALHASPLEVVAVSRTAGVVAVELDGYVELTGECDGPRVLEQLRLTALQFSDVDRVEIYLHGTPLSSALGGTAAEVGAR